ncbi:hypothetical protein F2Q70_00014925 [Brassica cretica]|uniref:RNase H type-1 domain-containing protein n=1 Tax=Brassica cretica TaxID=69181 RepID=A0A8S9KW61_BRACR|nr:hypothetical protein F2Q70_00014925 [Brassica cretica]KAF2597901.1 hypothetical protein F2Q68_00008035 [Brassica cretica]
MSLLNVRSLKFKYSSLLPINAEASGLIWAMQEIRDRGFDGVNFGSDCEQLINLIQREDEWPALAPDLDDIKFLSTCFYDVDFSYVPRDNNIRADSLAKGGRSRGHYFTIVDVLVHSRLVLAAGLNRLE